ncbi:TadE family protein [Allopontixanthobacter sp.]|uniref:TadE/TadG family type IV pilus assembly protein n=1 Tax=Allopontixanthobacter sp. TaxID=2906452 RepID=UPI002ABBF406|nr:TadE family protein [Allopontixanthobacter sp.]MDZ4306457.1 TadE family protein [Allopontixanthobacter sp.]
MIMAHRIHDLLRDLRGSMAIETAIVAPVLILMALGTFEAGTIVSRQHQLQSGASEGETIAMAAAQGAATNADQIRDIIADSLDLPPDKVTVTRMYRCNASTNRVSAKENCPTGAVVTSYVNIVIRDTYTPVWTQFGVGGPVNLQVNRMVVLLS